MGKTLLLVFIHGFKGDDNTFHAFPEHLRQIVSSALPSTNVVAITYPQYDTRGILSECVAGFREWLQNKVIDIEVEAGTPSPIIDPSVRVVLVGHSMGGIVAAEVLLAITSDQVIPPAGNSSAKTPATADSDTLSEASNETSHKTNHNSSTFLFPQIQGVLAFDTPYLGIHPGVVAHGAEAHYNTASAAFNAYTEATKFFGGIGSNSSQQAAANATRAGTDALAKSGSNWGNYALYAGGIATLAAAGGAAWMNRSQLATGWTWATSHLEFVGCLARGAELASRVQKVAALGSERKIGFADFYTQLGTNEGKSDYAGKLLGEERTFCVVPKEAKMQKLGQDDAMSPAKKRKSGSSAMQDNKGTWVACVNTKVDSEIAAHRSMFTPLKNSDYDSMSEQARSFILKWVEHAWHEDSDTETRWQNDQMAA